MIRRTQKILTIVLVISLVISCSIYVMAVPPNNDKQFGKNNNDDTEIENPIDEIEEHENETELEGTSDGKGKHDTDITLNITKVTTSKVITYSWDLNAELIKDHPTNNTALFHIQAFRYIEADELTISIDAELDQEISLDTIKVELGDKINEIFEPVKTYEVSQFTQSTIEGISKINFDLVIDLLNIDETELGLLQKVRLSIPIESKNGNDTILEDTHGFSIPDTSTVINAGAVIDTNLLETLVGIGSTDVLEDDWIITEEDLDENNLFEREIEIQIENIQDAKDTFITVELIGDNNNVLKVIEVKLTAGEDGLSRYIWTGDVHHIHGFWLPPVTDNFILDRNSIQIKFWLAEAPSETLSIHIYEGTVDDLGNVTMGDLVAEITQEELRTRKSGRKCRTWGENMEGKYYKYNLKARSLESLIEGKTYVFAVMVGDELLVYDEDTPAILTFKVGENLLATKQELRVEHNHKPRRNGLNRNY